MLTATNNDTPSVGRRGRPRNVPKEYELHTAAEAACELLLKIGSAWQIVPGKIRLPRLVQAHKLEDLFSRMPQEGRKESPLVRRYRACR
jgi:hypothetical protein